MKEFTIKIKISGPWQAAEILHEIISLINVGINKAKDAEPSRFEYESKGEYDK